MSGRIIAAPELDGIVAPSDPVSLVAEIAFCPWLVILPGQGKRASAA